MTIAIEYRPCDTSNFVYLEQSRFCLPDDASEYSGAANVGVTRPSWDERIDELHRLYILEDDWDGGGSPAPAPALVDGAKKLALTLKAEKHPPADRVTASVDGTIYFEWYTPAGYEEIEVTSPVDAEWRSVEKGADEADMIRISIR